MPRMGQVCAGEGPFAAKSARMGRPIPCTARRAPSRRGGWDMTGRVICIDDDQDPCALFEVALRRLGHSVATTTSPIRALDLLGRESFDVIVTDLGMHEMDGLTLCECMVGTRPDVPVIVVTGRGSLESAIGAMRAGTFDFLVKPIDCNVLALSVARAAAHRRLHHEVQRLRLASDESAGGGLLARRSPCR